MGGKPATKPSKAETVLENGPLHWQTAGGVKGGTCPSSAWGQTWLLPTVGTQPVPAPVLLLLLCSTTVRPFTMWRYMVP